MKALILSGLSTILLIAASLGCKETSSRNAPTNGIQVTASELIAAYKENEVAADEQYKDRALAVTGTVETIGKDIVDSMYVTLTGNGEMSFPSIQCMFADEHKSELASLRKGQRVRVVGMCRGKFGNILLRECSIRP